jgi:hypothetical protein
LDDADTVQLQTEERERSSALSSWRRPPWPRPRGSRQQITRRRAAAPSRIDERGLERQAELLDEAVLRLWKGPHSSPPSCTSRPPGRVVCRTRPPGRLGITPAWSDGRRAESIDSRSSRASARPGHRGRGHPPRRRRGSPPRPPRHKESRSARAPTRDRFAPDAVTRRPGAGVTALVQDRSRDSRRRPASSGLRRTRASS